MHSLQLTLVDSEQKPVTNPDCCGHYADCHLLLGSPCRLALGAIATGACFRPIVRR